MNLNALPAHPLTAVFVDANQTLALGFRRLHQPKGWTLRINEQADVSPDELPALLGGATIAVIDHTAFPTAVARKATGLRHVVFLGTGARSYMNIEELAELGISVHTIKGYGDVAVAECAFGLMWAAAKKFGLMDRGIRAGQWLRTDGTQLRGKTLGLVGFGGIAQELARLAIGAGMNVVAWNRSPKAFDGVTFLELDDVLGLSDVISLHLLLDNETRGLLSRDRIAALRPGAILVNTARGALLDEDALVDALRSGHIAHAALDVFVTEPLPEAHPLANLPNVTLSAHSAFRTLEASDNLVIAALAHCERIADESAFAGAA